MDEIQNFLEYSKQNNLRKLIIKSSTDDLLDKWLQNMFTILIKFQFLLLPKTHKLLKEFNSIGISIKL